MNRFPNTLGDGTFTVRLRFEATPGEGLASIQTWLSDWATAHSEELIFGFRFLDLFSSAPVAIPGPSGQLWIILRGIAADKTQWKDWYARLVRDALDTFPDLGKVSGVEDYA
jgi:hypothetical protein